MIGVRFQYYSAWAFIDAGAVACGLSYNGKNKEGKDQWNRIQSIKIFDIEIFGFSPRDMIPVSLSISDEIGLEPPDPSLAETLRADPLR